MRRRALLWMVLVLAGLVAVPVAAQERGTVVDLLADDNAGQFSLLVSLLESAGLTDALRGAPDVTVFAPTDDALAASLEALGMTEDDLMADPAVLSAILQYHVVPERLFARNLFGGGTFATLQGEDITITSEGGVLAVNGVGISGVDRATDNGVVFFIDGLLIPSSLASAIMPAEEDATDEPAAEPTVEPTVEPTMEPTAVPTTAPTEVPTIAAEEPGNTVVDFLANDGQFTALIAAAEAAGLAETLSGDGPFTVFAPTDDAFAASLESMSMTQEQLMGNIDALTALVRYHVVPERLFARNLFGGGTFTTLQGEPVTIAVGAGGVLAVNGVGISGVDRTTDNGVVFIIDGLLVPPSLASTMVPEAMVTEEPTPEPTAVPVDEAMPAPTVDPATAAHVRIALMSPDASAVNAAINGDVVADGVEPFTVTGWLAVPAGTHSLALTPEGGETLFGPVDFAVDIGTWTTLLVAGSFENGSALLQPVLEDYSPIAAGNSRITFVHALEGGPAVDVLVNGGISVANLAYPGTVGNNDGAFVVEGLAGTAPLDIRLTGGSTVIISDPAVEFASQSNYLIIVTGTPDAPRIVTVATDMAAVEGM